MMMPPELAKIIADAQAARRVPRNPYGPDPSSPLYYLDPNDVTDGNTMNLYGPSLGPPGSSLHVQPDVYNFNLLGPLARVTPPWLRKRFDRGLPTTELVEKPDVRVPMWNEPNYSIPAPRSKWYA
jgi:hypothetical protein